MYEISIKSIVYSNKDMKGMTFLMQECYIRKYNVSRKMFGIVIFGHEFSMLVSSNGFATNYTALRLCVQ